MRRATFCLYLVALVSAYAATAGATSPDGPSGTVWIDLDAAKIVDGKWEATRGLSAPDGNELNGKAATGAVGVVVGNRVTLLFGLAYHSQTATEQFGKRPGDPTSGLNLTSTWYTVSAGVRVYLNPPNSVVS